MTAARALSVAARMFRRHLLVYAGVLASLIALALAGIEWRWASWPLLAWSILLLIHYLLHKTSIVDERWAEDRVEELNLKSYDRGHIESIKTKQARDGGAER